MINTIDDTIVGKNDLEEPRVSYLFSGRYINTDIDEDSTTSEIYDYLTNNYGSDSNSNCKFSRFFIDDISIIDLRNELLTYLPWLQNRTLDLYITMIEYGNGVICSL